MSVEGGVRSTKMLDECLLCEADLKLAGYSEHSPAGPEGKEKALAFPLGLYKTGDTLLCHHTTDFF